MGKRIAQRCDQSLSVRIYAPVLLTEAQRSGRNQHLRRRQFPKKLIGEFHDEIGIATCYWMADLVTLRGIEKDNLVRIGDDLLLPYVSDKYTPVGKDKVRSRRALLGAAMSTCARTSNVSHGQ